ncbi:MAG: TIGR02680 family protein [Peptococcaceae bacterium]|nr:TIGR02680 family protein [Peptococcaceae bacterium]
MNKRWQAHRFGLVNFWCYDDQAFYFARGRMLLRGANGSGKSVTMQSVLPLLLDGDTSPERLDPFGSRDRKMSTYLLNEDDEREERTGYLYLEFKREETEDYLTIGMGLRARRGKPLDKWYFSLTDGRRIGKGFYLYKEISDRIPLSKRELENRIDAGGVVFDKQSDYMSYVNRQIFGFETTEDYKELLDLLIQLRTPKLSKDFKPSLINDILSDSLSALSEDDLRPMAEAIENMDNLTLNLKKIEDALQAATRILRVFDDYNTVILYEKASAAQRAARDRDACQKGIDEATQEQEALQADIGKLTQALVDLEDQRLQMEAEKSRLSTSDAVGLKERVIALEAQIADNEGQHQNKEKNLEEKQAQARHLELRQEKVAQAQEEALAERSQHLQALQEAAEAMAFQEYDFFKEEVLDQAKETPSFAAHRRILVDTREKIDAAYGHLQEAEAFARQDRAYNDDKDQLEQSLTQAQKKRNDWDRVVEESKSEWKERLYSWQKDCNELYVDKDILASFCHFIDDYDGNSDFSGQVRSVVSNLRDNINSQLNWEEKINRESVESRRIEREAAINERDAWINMQEPEPTRSEAILANRRRLDEAGIPYQEFYKVIEFGADLDDAQAGLIEEALTGMGVLDALVIEERYKNEVLAFSEGCADHYLFAGETQVKHSLLDVLTLNDAYNDLFSNQRFTSILASISYGWEAQGPMAIGEDGHYQMGSLHGTVTGQYEAQYLGTQARARTRERRIAECEARIQLLEQEISALDEAHGVLLSRRDQLDREYAAFPNDEDLREAVRMAEEADRVCIQLAKEKEVLEEKILAIRARIREKREAAFAVTRQLNLECSYAVVTRAKEAGERYTQILGQLEMAQHDLQTSLNTLSDLTLQLEQIAEDIDRLFEDLRRVERSLKNDHIEKRTIEEQLALTDYEAVKARLDTCVSWLETYPQKLNTALAQKNAIDSKNDQLSEKIEAERARLAQLEALATHNKQAFDEEVALGYVSMEDGAAESAYKVVRALASRARAIGKESKDLEGEVREKFVENASFLSDYQVSRYERFEKVENRTIGMSQRRRIDIQARYQGNKVSFVALVEYLQVDIANIENLIKDGDRELFEDILANTVSRKIRAKIFASTEWARKMNALMQSMNTSSTLKLSLKWRAKIAEHEDQLDTRELVELLKKDYRLMSESDAAKLSLHFRSKVDAARREAKNGVGALSLYQVMKETLDYRQWFEFQILSQKAGERQKELTNSVFGTFSGGEKAMAMYVPLFSAVVAKYESANQDAPRLISLDEAFAGVDGRNIRDMFRLMSECAFNYIINSQVLWGDYDTIDALAIYQLERPNNAKFVFVMSYLWNGKQRQNLEYEAQVEEKSEAIDQS